MTELFNARFPEDREDVLAIFREYVASTSVDLAFQDFEAEFACLPGKYASPEGTIVLAKNHGAVVGCAALRKVNATTCELKRVYVRPAAMGANIGRRLVENMLQEARVIGYTTMCLDVLPEFVAAQKLYESMGFVPTEPVSYNPVPGTKFLALKMT